MSAIDLRRVSPPLTHADKLKVVSLEMVKLQARVTGDDENALIGSYIEAAYDYLSGPNGWLGRCCLLEEEWECYLPSSGMGFAVDVPMRPLKDSTVTDFSVVQPDGTTYGAVSTSLWHVAASEGFARLGKTFGYSWPYFGAPHPRAYRIRFTAGFGTTGESIPSPIRQAIAMLAAHWFRQRETAGEVQEEVAYGLKALCGRYRMAPDHS